MGYPGLEAYIRVKESPSPGNPNTKNLSVYPLTGNVYLPYTGHGSILLTRSLIHHKIITN